jgi:hypothetical protein
MCPGRRAVLKTGSAAPAGPAGAETSATGRKTRFINRSMRFRNVTPTLLAHEPRAQRAIRPKISAINTQGSGRSCAEAGNHYMDWRVAGRSASDRRAGDD